MVASDRGSADVAAAHREAIRLVRKHREAIEWVAAALRERGALSGDEVDALIDYGPWGQTISN